MTTNIDDLRPGQYFTTRTGGIGGAAIRIGTHSPVNHAGLYVGGGKIVEAQPGKQGAIISDADRYPDAHWSDYRLTRGQGNVIAAYGKVLAGSRYNWPDIAAIVLSKLGIGDEPGSLIAKRVEKVDKLICSQLVDRAYLNADVHLFNDGRLSGQVTPADLYTVRYTP